MNGYFFSNIVIPDGAELFHFDTGFSSSDANLTSFVTDNTVHGMIT